MAKTTKTVTANGLRSGSIIIVGGEEREICMVDKSNQHNRFAAITFMSGTGLSGIKDSDYFERVSY